MIKTLKELKQIIPDNNHLFVTDNVIQISNLGFYMSGQVIDRIRIQENDSDGFVVEITLKNGGDEGQIEYDSGESSDEYEYQLQCIMESESAYRFMSKIEEELRVDFEDYNITKELYISDIDSFEYSFEVEIESPEEKINPVKMIEEVLEDSYSEDWAENPTQAAVYGILVGWDSEEDIQDDEDNLSYSGLQRKFGWSDEYIEKLRKAHKALQELKN